MLQVNFNPFPALETAQLRLRRLEATDVNEVYALRSDDHVTQFIARNNYVHLEEAAKMISNIQRWGEANESIMWAIVPKNEVKLIGTACLWNIDTKNWRSEIGYDLLPAYHGKGIMSETVKAVIDFGFTVMGLHTIGAHVNPYNGPSIKLLERHGFKREAYFKESVFYNGRFIDEAVYTLINNTASLG